jgi:fructose-bisphosphate aldolase, class I
MHETIQKLLAPAKGILAADESTKTISKRFEALGIVSTPELNGKYREMLFGTTNIENFLSGVILFDETVRQKNHEGVFFTEYLGQMGIVPGIKVDQGLEPFGGGEEEVTKGLEGLSARLVEYFQMGLKFSKWRAVIKISDIFPTDSFLDENIGRMAKYAKLSQDAGVVPLVEPEVLLDGKHTTTRCAEIIEKTLIKLFEKLNDERVDLTNLIIKTSMVLPGKDSGVEAAPFEVAQFTLRALNKTVPSEVPGIVFLSGGQSPDQATSNLNEIAKQGADSPWELSFSFSRALQEEAMKEWAGKEENVNSAREVFYKRVQMVSKARQGLLE